MKKVIFFAIFLALFWSGASSFAQEAVPSAVVQDAGWQEADNMPVERLFIEGSSDIEEHLEFFTRNFTIEAAGAGFSVVEAKDEAAYTFKFYSTVNPDKDFDYNEYILNISLVNNSSAQEILSFDFFFSELEEMFAHTQYLFHQATLYIQPVREIITETQIDRRWQNKWLYFRASIDYPVAFYALQKTDLAAGQAAYRGERERPDAIEHLENLIFPRPGLTVGIEFQFLRFMSLELNFMMNLGEPYTYLFLNMAASAQIKYNFKTTNFMFQPYGAFLYPINYPTVFTQYPMFAAGAGLQTGIRGGAGGSFFLDINFFYFFGDVKMENPFTRYVPEPPEIHYKHFVFGIAVGYKYGVFNRK